MGGIRDDIKCVLVGKNDIKKKVKELAGRINRDYKGKDLVMIGVLKGSVVFFAELFKNIDLPVSCDFIAISSYGALTKSTGVVRLIKDVDNPVMGKHVLLVEDIIDSGVSMSYLIESFAGRGAESVKVCTLLDKPSRRRVELTPDYCGFEIPNEFVVGYGLDYAEKYRNMPDVCVLKESVYSGQ